MYSFEGTRLWATTLAESPDDEGIAASQRERLRLDYFKLRERAEMLAGEIHRTLPEFTVHDISHSDALWEMADLIAGPCFQLTPTEAFILGGAFLVHDLGMGLAAYPEGSRTFRESKRWSDALVYAFRNTLGRDPTSDDLQNPPPDVERSAVAETLRNLHAEQAEHLAVVHWENDGETYHLLEDPDLRRDLGPIIGRVAHSHWWPVRKLGREFEVRIGAPYGCPREWTIDPLKIACLLRVADISHIDSRRAPGFLRAIRDPQGFAEEHWTFQERLHQPQLQHDRLLFTSGQPFAIDKVAAWWLCFDTLQAIDRELRQVDALLTDTNRQRLAAQGVVGADDAKRLAALVPTEGWTPIDAKLKVGDVAELIKRLGGEQLYGRDPTIPLRELIQNACDAVRARRKLENRSDSWGRVTVRVGQDSRGPWLEVEDVGVGMSTRVLTDELLDFGARFWNSDAMRQEFPGLAASGFQSTGEYGIGFFSVFMWGQRVLVTTRRFDVGQRETLVLEFERGLESRPIVRDAIEKEIVRDGGTRVRVWLDQPMDEPPSGLLYYDSREEGVWTLSELCSWLCPSADVDIFVEQDGTPDLAVSANDWKTMDGAALIRRIGGPDAEVFFGDHSNLLNLADNLRYLKNKTGTVVGRACIDPSNRRVHTVNSRTYGYRSGIVTVGGLRSSDLDSIAGILFGDAVRATRDAAIPRVHDEELAAWASEQANLLSGVSDEPALQADLAAVVKVLGGDTGALCVARSSLGWLTSEDIRQLEHLPNEVILVNDDILDTVAGLELTDFSLNSNVFLVRRSYPVIVHFSASSMIGTWPSRIHDPENWYRNGSLAAAVVEALAKAWGTSVQDVVQVSDIPRDEGAVIGIGDGRQISFNADVIRNPKSLG